MSEEQKEMQVEAAEKAAKKVAPVTTAEPEENFDWVPMKTTPWYRHPKKMR